MRCRPCSRRQRGAALVLALMIFALCAALIVAMTGDFTRVYQQAGNLFVAGQSRAYLQTAEGLATLALQVDFDQQDPNSARDTLNDVWARPSQPYPLEDGSGWIAGSLEDLQGRFDLNLLAEQDPDAQGDGPRFKPAQAQFIRLLLAVGEPGLSEADAIAITRAVGDWEDADGETRPQGAEDDYYLGLTPAYRAANRPMRSVSELRAVKGVTPGLYAALEPWVTVWPPQGGALNIHTAPAMVLRSLGADDSLRPLSADEALALVHHRCESDFAGVDDLLAQPVFGGGGEQGRFDGLRALLGEKSAYFLLRAQAEVAGRNTRLYSVLQRQGREVNVLERTTDGRDAPDELKREEACET